MRVCLIATNNFVDDPRAGVLAHQLSEAGHEVHVVASGPPPATPPSLPATFIPTAHPDGWGVIGRAIRRTQSPERRTRLHERALATAALKTGATVFHPTSARAVPAARLAALAGKGAVARQPNWPSAAPRDLIDLAPSMPEFSSPVAAGGRPFHTPDHRRAASHPEPGRHRGRRIALAYRKTDSNPGKYLEAALRRAGLSIDLHTDAIDLGSLHPETEAVVFVEGPYPALDVQGTAPGIPVAFWVHHGEHHLAANLRLARHYRADLILLAHSWHLSHYFPKPVQRFPFGMPPDLFDGSKPLAERRFDVAMVGAHLRGGGPYPFRQELVASLERSLGADRTAFEENVSAARMAELYEEARIIPNEGGTRHFPITMRVLEAVGAGAVLVTQPIPGLDQILEAGVHYFEMADDPVAQMRDLLADPERLQEVADAARRHVTAHHLYDHRVDELLDGLATVTPASGGPYDPPTDPLSALIDRDVEVQRILVPAPGPALDLPDREVWTTDQVSDPAPATYEAVAVDRPTDPSVLRAARRYIYGADASDALRTYLIEEQPQAELREEGRLTRIDLKAASYRAT